MTTQREILASAAAKRGLELPLFERSSGETLWGAACAALRRAGANDEDINEICRDTMSRPFGKWA